MKEVWKYNVTLYLPHVLPDGTDDVDYRGPHVVGPVLVGGDAYAEVIVEGALDWAAVELGDKAVEDLEWRITKSKVDVVDVRDLGLPKVVSVCDLAEWVMIQVKDMNKRRSE